MKFSRYRIHLVLVLAVMVMLMPIEVEGLWWRELFNSAHVIIFTVVAYVLLLHLKSNPDSSVNKSAYLFTVLLGLALGVMVEVVQGFVGREMSLQDLYRDLCGLIAGASLATITTSQKHAQSPAVVIIFLLVFIGALLFGAFGLLQMSSHYIQRHEAFPTLTELDQGWSSSFVRFDQAEFVTTVRAANEQRDNYFRMLFKPGKYPGISVIEVEPDWSGYRSLHFDVVSQQDDEISLTLRVHDVIHDQDFSDRYNRRLRVHKGMNEFYIDLEEMKRSPEGRDMEMETIMGIKLFISDLKAEVLLDISNFELQ